MAIGVSRMRLGTAFTTRRLSPYRNIDGQPITSTSR